MSKLLIKSLQSLSNKTQPNLIIIRQYRSTSSVPKLTPNDVNLILRANEFTHEFSDQSAIKFYDTNQLPSNSPMEDARSEAAFLHNPGLLFGVFDGHAGTACAQVASKRIMRYLAASLVPPEELRYQITSNKAKSHSFLQCLNDKLEFVPEIRDVYEKSFEKFALELIERNSRSTVIGLTPMSHEDEDDLMSVPKKNRQPERPKEELIQNAFLRLDQDMSDEALESPSVRTLSVAMSGAVACVAHVDGIELRVAGVGDCCAVLGSINESGQWTVKKLSTEHNSENRNEVRRILSEHPPNEKDTVIRLERLLGQLAPLRALGDFRYKWPKDVLEKFVVPHFGENVIPPYYLTPPYLTALPEVQHHTLTPKDQFLVLATDGLWDVLSPMQVVRLVGEHMNGKVFLQPLELPANQDVSLGELSDMLAHRKTGLSSKPLDKNSATHLIRNALGGTDYGIEHSKISHILSLPPDVVRLFRDDITVSIIYFNSEYLQNNLVV